MQASASLLQRGLMLMMGRQHHRDGSSIMAAPLPRLGADAHRLLLLTTLVPCRHGMEYSKTRLKPLARCA